MDAVKAKTDDICPAIDICIATYKRPELLRKLLKSVCEQEANRKFSFKIIVVDNDIERSAEKVVAAFNENTNRIKYDVEPQKNVSYARNRLLKIATGDYLAFIDDDEHVKKNWLVNLFEALQKYQADIVFGPSISQFLPNTPKYIRKSKTFNLPNHDEGATKNVVYNTGNCIINCSILRESGVLFDAAFGGTLGEDTDFFEKLRRWGAKIVWTRKAIVYETILPERAKLAYIVKRNFRIGNVYLRLFKVEYINVDAPKLLVLSNLLLIISRGIVSAFGSFLGAIFDRRYFFYGCDKFESVIFNLGIFAYLLNYRSDKYR